jgi:glyoxylase-like metal-dependent hydrolase (beta-lactamase superfamily II)
MRSSMIRYSLVGALVATALGIGALLRTFSASPLPAPAPFAGPLPPSSPPAEMSIAALPTGMTHRSAAFAYRGGSFFERRDFAMAALLVRHPRGDLLVDTGFGREIDAQFRLMPWPFRIATRYSRGRSAAEQLDAVGYDRRRLRGMLLTHAHWDHVSGIPELAGTPVLVTAEERRFIREGGALTVVARSLPDVRYEEYGFEGGAHLGFPSSHDVHGDGSIVVVPAPGHTPGAVIVFVTLPTGRRLALVGDLVWQREGITLREERPWLLRSLSDADPAGVRDTILRMAALAARIPELEIVPAHDARAFAELSHD